MNKKKFLMLFSCFLLGLSLYAQKRVGLREAIDYSLKNHKSAVIYNNKIGIATNQKKDAVSEYLPQVNGSLGFDYNIKRQTTVFPGAMLGSPTDVEVQFGNTFTGLGTIQLDQTIYDQALIFGIKAGIPAQLMAELNRDKNNEDLSYNTAMAFFQILVLKEQQKILVANEKQYDELYRISKLRFDKGAGKKVDVDRVVVRLNDLKADLKQIELDINVAYNSLRNAMGSPLDDSFVIEENLDYSKYLEIQQDTLNIKNLIGYKLQEQNIILQEIDLKRKQAAFLPTVDAFARFGEQAFGNELDTAFGRWKDFSLVGLKVNVPIFSGGHRDSQIKISRLELDNAKQDLNLGVADFEIKFENARRQLPEDITKLNSNKTNMELAKSIYDTNKFEYDKGVALMSDLLDTDFTYRQAESKYMSSLFNLVTNRLIYERAKGTIRSFVNQL
jgi:outer membrane protein